ncbi:MAG: 16S rRNA (uracil(1498)-N(3))-methyltransferase [Firmicutes bacterium]|nr:16S rRNA (uracil(1498)-N(3))-methyltransferase [Bacillota bacterium]
MPKFFVTREDIQGNYILIRKDTHHILHVLRKSKGDLLELCDGKNTDYLCEIIEVSRNEDQLICKILKRMASSAEAALKVFLYQALPKGDKMELILQKGTEIGVYGFIPFNSQRCIVHLDPKRSSQKVERWNKICVSGAKQSGRGNIPAVSDPMNFKDAVNKAVKETDLVLVCYENEQTVSLKTALTGYGEKPSSVSIFIGPEGGFDTNEIDYLTAQGVRSVSLGPRILRTETAGMVASAMVLYHFDEMERKGSELN